LPQDDPRRRQPNIELAVKELGWEPKTRLKDGLGATIDYFRERLGI
jgi:UDP-glucuronate decarboxylase